MRKFYTLAEITKSLPKSKNKNSSLWAKLAVRRPSFLFTALFINVGFSPWMASIFSVFVAVAGCVFLSINNPNFIIAGVVLVELWLVMDCVDGNIARVKKQSSKMGEFIDAFSGYFVSAYVYLSIGIAAYHTSNIIHMDKHYFLMLGAIASISDILARLIHQKYLNCNPQKIQAQVDIRKKSLSYIRLRIEKELGISGFFMPFLIISLIFNVFDVMIVFYALFSVCGLLASSSYYAYKAHIKHVKMYQTILCIGAFDILNKETITQLQELKKHTFNLVVGILQDSLVIGNNAINTITDRLRLATAIAYVDNAITIENASIGIAFDSYYLMRDIENLELDPNLTTTLKKKTPCVFENNVQSFVSEPVQLAYTKKYNIGFAPGTFDIFHVGHLNIIEKAVSMSNQLIVGVKEPDELSISLGKEPPILSYDDRSTVVAAIKGVTSVIPLYDLDRLKNLGQLKFDALFIGDDLKDSPLWKSFEKTFNSVGVDIVWVPYTKSVSSTVLREQLKSLTGGRP
ncbi:MAG: adenylyltransferase/cytidyltransferase family protein [Christensenellaceae bacterium]|jgi:glycerol-3-phosphate cytidylyltransferase|nr:adenylyltransferase/cytidyltransferase family protein [Christensenellaceae bacterium]